MKERMSYDELFEIYQLLEDYYPDQLAQIKAMMRDEQ